MSQAKKLEKEFLRGLEEGAKGTNSLWHAALESTKFVGPVTQKRILERLREIVKDCKEAGE